MNEQSHLFSCLAAELVVIIYGEVIMTTVTDLTSRELEILHLVLAGYTNKAIAAEIYISEKTVEFYLNHVTQRLVYEPA